MSFAGSVGGITALVVASFTRPANTTSYAVGQLVANNVAAGLVVPMTLPVTRLSPSAAGKGGMIRRAQIFKSGTVITNAQFRLHLYSVAPTPSNGDGGAWLTNGALTYSGAFDVTMDRVFTDGASGRGIPTIGSEVSFLAVSLFGLIEARAAYAPISGEVFTCQLEVVQN